LKIPFRATSIIPLEKVAPTNIPRLATDIMVFLEATRDPMEELRKFTASLLTPTTKSEMARTNKRMTITRYRSDIKPEPRSRPSFNFVLALS
jgi:hypothetical protein